MKQEVENKQPQIDTEAGECRSYIIGFVLSVILTCVAFGLVWLKMLPIGSALAVISILAMVQIIVHLRCFLHVDHEKSHRDDLWLVLLTILILGVVIAGTIWTLWNQHMRMMP